MKLHGAVLAAATVLTAVAAGAQTTPPATTAPQVATQQPGAVPAPTAPNPTVGGVAMLPTRSIAENVAAAATLSQLATAIRAAGLDPTLSGPGPFTIFAPTDAAFGRLAPGTLATLLKPENKATLVKVLSYHVVPGRITVADLKARTAAGGGSTTLTTLAGQPLTVSYAANVMTLTDPGGNRSYLEIPDIASTNGVVQVVNGVLVPRLQ